jgi:two-component system, LytTR family, sensor histidine kinase AlgZ
VQIPNDSIVRATWAALLKPKRLVPVVAICIPLIMVQGSYSSDDLAIPLAILMCVSFVLLAPVTYRVLFPSGLDFDHGAVRIVLYALVSAGVVLSVGIGVPKVLSMGHTFLTDRMTLLVSVAMFLVGGWGLGRDIQFESRVERLTQEAAHAQLLALKNHLDPHFLFNTLNALAEWCRIDGAVAEKAILQLSHMLRTILEGVKTPLWPLEKEIELVRMLFSLHLLRDANLFSVEEKIPASVGYLQVPAMCLLSLAENAVKHGPAKGHRGTILFEIETIEGGLRISIENPGPNLGPRKGSEGLVMLNTQLKQLNLKPVAMTSDGNRTRATLEIAT